MKHGYELVVGPMFSESADAEKRGANLPNPEFEVAVDAMMGGDVVTLRGVLERRPYTMILSTMRMLLRRRHGGDFMHEFMKQPDELRY